MSSLVEELQAGAMNPNVLVSTLLRQAKVVAHKLDLPELLEWVEQELNGYHGLADPIGKYREYAPRIEAFDPYWGWKTVLFEDPQAKEILSKRRSLGASVPELEGFLKGDEEYPIFIPLPDSLRVPMMQRHGVSDVGMRVSRTYVESVLAAVRNLILDWSLKLEKLGIKGEGMSFSAEEKGKAHRDNSSITIGSIGNFAGNIGSQSFDRSAIRATQTSNSVDLDALRALAIQIKQHTNELPKQSLPAVRAELEKIDEELAVASPNQSKIRAALGSMKNALEGAAGSIIASGILAELTRLLSH
jgi:hypothetical protein